MANTDLGKSVPDQSNADNPSKTGVPSVNSQGTDVARKGGTAKEQRGQSDSERNPNNHTVRYGSDRNVNAKQAGNNETAREFAERGVVEKHGEPIRQNPQFDELVKEEQRQIEENRRNTEGM